MTIWILRSLQWFNDYVYRSTTERISSKSPSRVMKIFIMFNRTRTRYPCMIVKLVSIETTRKTKSFEIRSSFGNRRGIDGNRIDAIIRSTTGSKREASRDRLDRATQSVSKCTRNTSVIIEVLSFENILTTIERVSTLSQLTFNFDGVVNLISVVYDELFKLCLYLVFQRTKSKMSSLTFMISCLPWSFEVSRDKIRTFF